MQQPVEPQPIEPNLIGSRSVAPQRRATRGGGIFLMAGLLAGFGIGVWQGQGSLGILIGLVVGGAAAAIVAWRDARRG